MLRSLRSTARLAAAAPRARVAARRSAPRRTIMSRREASSAITAHLSDRALAWEHHDEPTISIPEPLKPMGFDFGIDVHRKPDRELVEKFANAPDPFALVASDMNELADGVNQLLGASRRAASQLPPPLRLAPNEALTHSFALPSSRGRGPPRADGGGAVLLQDRRREEGQASHGAVDGQSYECPRRRSCQGRGGRGGGGRRPGRGLCRRGRRRRGAVHAPAAASGDHRDDPHGQPVPRRRHR